jgi:CRP-like cAMP-binding protein
MISPEILRQYPFFGILKDAQLKAIAMIADEVSLKKDVRLFKKGESADTLYFLLHGGVELYNFAEATAADGDKGVLVGTVNPGEPFAISAVIEPHIFTSTAWTSSPSRAIGIEAAALRKLFDRDRRLAFVITRQASRAAMERLHATRVQLAAALA